MFGMRIGMVVMVMIMAVVMTMMMIMAVSMMMMMIQPAGPGAEMVAKLAVLDIASRRRYALPLDVMVVAFLHKTNLILEAEDLRPVFA